MSQYNTFSNVYDLFMDNIPYDEWANRIHKILIKNGIDDGLVLDLGCGTGTLTEILSKIGYDMIGIDSSEDMLAEAIEKKPDNADILYLCQDIREFELYGTVRAVISSCDTLNYMLEDEDLVDVFKLVNNYLEPDGIFIFDINAPEKYEEILADNVFAENRDDASFIWENTFDEKSRINEFALTLFIEDKDSGFYQKTEEFHYQRAYTREEILELLEKAGLEVVDISEKDMRMYYTVKIKEGRKLGNI